MKVTIRVGNSPYVYSDPVKCQAAVDVMRSQANRHTAQAAELNKVADKAQRDLDKGLAEDAAKAAAKKAAKRAEPKSET